MKIDYTGQAKDVIGVPPAVQMLAPETADIGEVIQRHLRQMDDDFEQVGKEAAAAGLGIEYDVNGLAYTIRGSADVPAGEVRRVPGIAPKREDGTHVGSTAWTREREGKWTT